MVLGNNREYCGASMKEAPRALCRSESQLAQRGGAAGKTSLGKLGAIALTALLTVAVTGCQSSRQGGIAPLAARLEPLPGANAKNFVLVNKSGHELRNFQFSVYLWNDNRIRQIRTDFPFQRLMLSGESWKPGAELRFSSSNESLEYPITQPLDRVEVVGHSDEGTFHQCWKRQEGALMLAGGP
jgi:hypothetical protein